MELESDVAGSLPLTETTFYILLSLSAEPSHGYRIMKEIEGLSYRRVCLSTGTLYGALRRLLEGGWIERVEDPGVAFQQDERERKFYALTERGRKVLSAEVKRLNGLVKVARQRNVESGA